VEAVEEVEVEIKAKHLWIAIQTAIFPNCHHSLESEKLNNELQFVFLPTNCRLRAGASIFQSPKICNNIIQLFETGIAHPALRRRSTK
jgi:hypothetical protein